MIFLNTHINVNLDSLNLISETLNNLELYDFTIYNLTIKIGENNFNKVHYHKIKNYNEFKQEIIRYNRHFENLYKYNICKIVEINLIDNTNNNKMYISNINDTFKFISRSNIYNKEKMSDILENILTLYDNKFNIILNEQKKIRY